MKDITIEDVPVIQVGNFEYYRKSKMDEYLASLNRQGWTRVETKLPKQGQRVLVATNTGSMEVGYYYKGYWERNWAGTTFGEAGYIITHWTPLPNKPII